MKPKVKILWFCEGGQTELAERQIETMIAEGWRIVAAGGGGDAPEQIDGQQMMYRPFGMGFVVLQHDGGEHVPSLRERLGGDPHN